MDIFFFQAKKKEAKKSPATTTATVSQTPQRFLVLEKTYVRFLTVGTDVLGCPLSSFLSAEKEAKRHRRLLPRLCPGLKAPGRNYKLLPALATNSPPDCLRSASRPQRFKVSVKLRRVASATLLGIDRRNI